MAGSNGTNHREDDFVLSFEDVADKDTLRSEDIPIPEWGKNAEGKAKKVHVVSMSDFDRRRFIGMGSMQDPENPGQTIRNTEFFDSGQYDVELLWRSCRKLDGSELFTRDQWRQLGSSKKSGPGPFIRLVDVALRVNILNDETFNEVRKNSEPPNDTKTSDSHLPSKSAILT